MTKRGRRVATGGPIGRPPKGAKGANAAVARSAKAARKQTTLETEAACAEAEATLAVRKEEPNAKKAALAERLAKLEAIKQAREQGRCVGMAGDASSKLSPAALEFLEDSVESLRPKTGELTTPHQSRMILLLYFDLLKGGSSENKAKDQVRNGKRPCLCIVDYSLCMHYFCLPAAVSSTSTGPSSCARYTPVQSLLCRDREPCLSSFERAQCIVYAWHLPCSSPVLHGV